jgi:predicted Rossmann fold nucleotide-binding protein DprA/Smf involved in DNA uptake
MFAGAKKSLDAGLRISGMTDKEYSSLILLTMTPVKVDKNDYACTASLSRYLGGHAPHTVTAIGNADILHNKALAVFCSNKCPGNIILKTYDLMRQIRDNGITVISGFHSAIERECLDILLNGRQPIIICPARSIEGMRIKAEYKKPLEDGRLVVLSPFTEKEKRISSGRALIRNQFVTAMADAILIPYAAPKSKTECFCREIFNWKKLVYTFDTPVNNHLIDMGVMSLDVDSFILNPVAFHLAKEDDR